MSERDYCVLVGWMAAELTEGQAAVLLGVDRLEARRLLNRSLEAAKVAWVLWRQQHPIGAIGQIGEIGHATEAGSVVG